MSDFQNYLEKRLAEGMDMVLKLEFIPKNKCK